MRTVPFDSSGAAALADRLAALKSLADAPRREIEWLVSRGELRAFDAGEIVVSPAADANDFIVILSGCVTVYVGQGGRRHAFKSHAGSLTGVLPYSRLKRTPSDVFAEEATELLAIHRDRLPEMIRECPVITESLVHVMLDRARRFSAISWNDEKVMSLGRLAAGLAHELNNPASAASSAAKHLSRAIREVGAAAHQVGMASLSMEQQAEITRLVARCQATGRDTQLSSMARFDKVEEITTWLEAHHVATECASDLVDGGVEISTLDGLASFVPANALSAVISWIASSAASACVVSELERATQRIHDVVSAVRDFTHLDRAAVREPIDVAQSITQTAEVMRSKAREKGATIRLDLGVALPKVTAVAADLNQAWSNLIENAVDAVDSGGEVVVCARAQDGVVAVDITDNGPGIPADIQARIFDPFFTTKPVGKGAGLGLDIVRRVVDNYGGEVEFSSEPGRTSFRVRLPDTARTA